MLQRDDPEWHTAKLGRVGASRVSDIIAKTKSGPSASRENYAVELALERITGEYDEDHFTSTAIEWGIEKEAEARLMYEMASGNMVDECGYFTHPTIDNSGASPDGLVGSDGLLEIKSPNSKQHLSYMRLDTVPPKYRAQVQWQLAVTRRKWCDFVSYDPRFPVGLQLHIARVLPDKEYIAMLEEEVTEFLKYVSGIVDKIRGMKNGISK